jgi:hypothetical protein
MDLRTSIALAFIDRVRQNVDDCVFSAFLQAFDTTTDTATLAHQIFVLFDANEDLKEAMNAFLPTHQQIPLAIAEQPAPVPAKTAPDEEEAAYIHAMAQETAQLPVFSSPEEEAAYYTAIVEEEEATTAIALQEMQLLFAPPPAPPAKTPEELQAVEAFAADAARECFRLLHRGPRQLWLSSALPNSAALRTAAMVADTSAMDEAWTFNHTVQEVPAAIAPAVVALVRLSQQLEQHRHLTKLARSASGQSALQTIGSFLFHNGHPLRQLSKCFSVANFGTLACRYGPKKLDLRAAIALIRVAVQAIHAQAPPAFRYGVAQEPGGTVDWLRDGGDSWWHYYGPTLHRLLKDKFGPDEPTVATAMLAHIGTYERELKGLQAVEHVAALDRMAAKVDAMTEAETNQFDMLRAVVNSETETLDIDTHMCTQSVLAPVLQEFIHGGHDCEEEVLLVKYPLVYPIGVHVNTSEDLSPVLTIHDTSGNLVPPLQKCSQCAKWSADAITRWCASKYCMGSHLLYNPPGTGYGATCGDSSAPTCAKCWGVQTCFTCNKSGCRCRFDLCSKQGCDHLLCNCTDFGGRKREECGPPPGCARFVPTGEEMDDDGPLFCFECAPEGARRNNTSIFLGFPGGMAQALQLMQQPQ